MMKNMQNLSPEYSQVAKALDGGWRGTYGDLALIIGKSRNFSAIISSLVHSYSRRNPGWVCSVRSNP
jgi:alkylated DNA nucleotide flippase Atl1